MNSGSRFPTRFITFTVLTCFGSYLSGFGAFLELGRQFPGLKLLALALSAKTLLLALLATPFAKYCKNKSIYSSLYFSQLLGIVIALLEALAFFSGNNFLIVLAIVISGIPTLFIAILSGPILHEHSQDQDRFKTYQGIFQFITGISALIAGLLAPWCLNLISIFGVLALDIFSFCLALLVLARSKMLIGYKTALEVDNGKPEKEYSPSLFVWNSHKTRVVFLTSTIFFAIGLIPMFSASDLGKQFGYSGLLVESLWALESFAALVVGLAYSRSSFLRNSQIGIVVSSFSLIPILILGRIFSPIVLVGSFLVYSVLTTYGVMRTRDDFLASAANLGERIGYSGFHQVLLNILRTVSPFLLWLLASYARSDQTEINLDIIVWVQFGLCFVVWPFLILASRLKSRGFLKLYSLSIIGFSTFVLVLVVVIFSSNLRDFQKQQVRVWIETLPKSILPNLIESDYIPIEQKIELLRKTGLLNSFAVYNASGRIIAAFPSMDSVPGSISVPIKDDTDNGWGELRYLPDEYLFIRILFFPVILLTIALGLLGALLSKLLQINAHHAETQLELKRDRAVALNQIAVQVSHDIRSPLSALDIALMDTSGLSEERRLLIRNAVNRIRDIANNLLQKKVAV